MLPWGPIALVWAVVLAGTPVVDARTLQTGLPAATKWEAPYRRLARLPGVNRLVLSGTPCDSSGTADVNTIGAGSTIWGAVLAPLRGPLAAAGMFMGLVAFCLARRQSNWVSVAVSGLLSRDPGHRARSGLQAMGADGDFSPEELVELAAEVRAMEGGGVPEDAEDPGAAAGAELPALEAYEGPELPWSALEAGVELQQLGLVVAVGPSSLGPEAGRGLYVALGDGVAEVSLPQGTLLCGYARGTMQARPQGNKSVAFAFDDLATPVFYNRQLMPLKDAIVQAAAATAAGNAPVDVSHALYGHLVYEKEGTVAVAPDPEVTARYFIPTEPPLAEVGVTSLGMFANDLAFLNLDPEEELYASLSGLRNVLELVWRVEWDAEAKRLAPSWPVVIMAREVAFKNRHAMEVGVRYGWRYWQSALADPRESKAEAMPS
eukprot:EG_transcript_11240